MDNFSWLYILVDRKVDEFVKSRFSTFYETIKVESLNINVIF